MPDEGNILEHAPKDGSPICAEFSDGVSTLRWNRELQRWDVALASGRWGSLEYQRGANPKPLSWRHGACG